MFINMMLFFKYVIQIPNLKLSLLINGYWLNENNIKEL